MKVAFLTIDAREFFKDYDTPLPYFGTAPQALLQGFASVADVEVHVIACTRQPVAHTPKIAPNIYFHSLLVPGCWTRELYARCVLAQRKKIRELQPDIVHGQGTERDCALAAAHSGFPNIVTIHGNMREVAKAVRAPLFSFFTVQGFLESWAIRRTLGVVCLTNHTRQKVQGLARRTWVLPNAVNASYFDVPRAAPTRDILCIAQINRNKSQNFLIRALDPLAQANGIRLVFVGAGDAGDPYFEEFQQLVKSRPWCVYEGYKRREELPAYYQSARLLALPSIEENCPMVVLEAMAVGVPVAAARSGGTPDLIEDGVTGLMFEPGDAEGVRAAILKIFQDENRAVSMAAAAKQHALDRHHPTRIAEKHVEIYRETLKTCS